MFSNNLENIEGVSIFPIIVLILFVLIFVGVIIWAIKVDKNYLRKMENLPLDNDDEMKTISENIK